jgi:ADP-ribosylglycohydrolase
MRIHPFVLYAYFVMPHETGDDHSLWMTLIRYASLLTHAHDRSVMACYIYGYILTSLLKEPTRESLAAGIQFAGEDLNHLPEFEHYTRLFAPDFAALPEDEIKSSGYVVDTLEAALWCLLTTDSYRDCVLKAVNLGGDTDTVAAVAGGLAGALYGYEGIPQAWRETLIKREWIEEMCERAGSEWGDERSQK